MRTRPRPALPTPAALLRAVVAGVLLVLLSGCTTTGADEGTRSAGQEGYVGVQRNVTQIAPADRTELPTVTGTYFSRTEPGAYQHTAPLPVESMVKFDGVDGLDRIYDSGSIRVYDTAGLLRSSGIPVGG